MPLPAPVTRATLLMRALLPRAPFRRYSGGLAPLGPRVIVAMLASPQARENAPCGSRASPIRIRRSRSSTRVSPNIASCWRRSSGWRTGCRWAEGPVWFGDGRYLLWSDIPNNRILKWEEETGAVSCSASPSNNANGNTRDRQGRLVTCEHDARRVTRTEYDGTITVLWTASRASGSIRRTTWW